MCGIVSRMGAITLTFSPRASWRGSVIGLREATCIPPASRHPQRWRSVWRYGRFAPQRGEVHLPQVFNCSQATAQDMVAVRTSLGFSANPRISEGYATHCARHVCRWRDDFGVRRYGYTLRMLERLATNACKPDCDRPGAMPVRDKHFSLAGIDIAAERSRPP